jgi:hypothetical protein
LLLVRFGSILSAAGATGRLNSQAAPMRLRCWAQLCAGKSRAKIYPYTMRLMPAKPDFCICAPWQCRGAVHSRICPYHRRKASVLQPKKSR